MHKIIASIPGEIGSGATQPRGDFISRNAFYDALLAGAIPVYFQDNYLNHLPYTDVIAYGDFLKYAPILPFWLDQTWHIDFCKYLNHLPTLTSSPAANLSSTRPF